MSRRFARFAIRVIAESGLLYTLTSLAATFSMAFLSSGTGFTIASAIVPRPTERRSRSYAGGSRGIL